jgi:antitoxin (DNA-binding transcriptional repressor) of toxin-antitoxin stability system
MSHTMPIEQAAATLDDLVAGLAPGDEIVLTRGQRPVAKIIPSIAAVQNRRAGSCKGMLIINQEDDEHLAAFAEYMP